MLLLLLEIPPVPKMLLVALGISVAAVVATAPKENPPVLLPPGLVALMACCEAVLLKAKLEFAVGCWPKAGLLTTPTPNIPEEGCEVTEVVELLVMLLNAGGAVVGGADAAKPPPKTGAVEVVMAEPKEAAEVAVEVVDETNPNFGTTDIPKVGFEADTVGTGAPEAAPPNENALVVADGVFVATADMVVVGFKVVPNVNPPPEVDATTLPYDGRVGALVVTTVKELVCARGLKALNPDPLPKVEMVD